MSINTVALIAGALSFTAAIAWNKAVSDTLQSITNLKSPSLSVVQAIIITLIIVIIVYFINIGINYHTKRKGVHLHDSILKSGGNKEYRVKLWNL